jgi:hypothetical protein
MADRTLAYDLVATDHLSGVFDKGGRAVEGYSRQVDRAADAELKAKSASLGAEKAALAVASARKRAQAVTSSSTASEEQRRRAVLAAELADVRHSQALRKVEAANRDLAAVSSHTGDELAATAKRTGLFGDTMRTAVAGGAALAGAALVKFGADGVDAASDLNESVSKAGVVFGGAAASVVSFGDTAATSLGQSKQQAIEAASTFGNLFVALKVGQRPAADMSTAMVKLASDLASFNNADPSQVLEDLRSGLLGESEPLRKYGVALNEAAVQQEAMRETGKRSATQLTEGEKVIGRYHLILANTTTAQGDFARTSGGLANQQRIAAAQAKDLSANVGKVLIPAVIGGTRAFNELAKPLGTVAEEFSKLPGPLQAAAVGTVAVAGGTTALLAVAGAVAPKIREGRDSLASLGRTGEIAAGAVGKIGKGLAIGSGVFLGLEGVVAIVDKLAEHAVHAAPGVNVVTQSLLTLSRADLGRTLPGLGDDISNIGKEFERASGDVTSFGDAIDKGISAVGPDSVQIRQARTDVGALDDALANLVTSGHSEDAHRAFEQLAIAAGQQGVSINVVEKSLPKYRDALAGVANATSHVTSTSHSAVRPLTLLELEAKALGIKFTAATTAAGLLSGAIDTLNGKSLDALDTDIQFRGSLDDVGKSLKDNGRSLDVNTEKGRANLTAIASAIKAARDHATAVANQTGSVDRGNTAFGQHVTQLRRVLTQAGLNKAEIERLIGTYAKVPRTVESELALKIAEAEARARRIQAQISAVHGKTVSVEVTQNGTVQEVQREIDSLTGRVIGIQVGLVRTGLAARQHGGAVAAHQPVIVGERRPEVFIPSTSGTIRPSIAGAAPGRAIGELVAAGAEAGVLRALKAWRANGNALADLVSSHLLVAAESGFRR